MNAVTLAHFMHILFTNMVAYLFSIIFETMLGKEHSEKVPKNGLTTYISKESP